MQPYALSKAKPAEGVQNPAQVPTHIADAPRATYAPNEHAHV